MQLRMRTLLIQLCPLLYGKDAKQIRKSLHESCLLQFLQILHMDAGGTLELRITRGSYIRDIMLNIELTGSGFNLV